MLNSPETYDESGRRAARALNDGDALRWRAELDFAQRLWSLESPRDRREARRLYDLAYLQTRRAKIAPRCGYGER